MIYSAEYRCYYHLIDVENEGHGEKYLPAASKRGLQLGFRTKVAPIQVDCVMEFTSREEMSNGMDILVRK